MAMWIKLRHKFMRKEGKEATVNRKEGQKEEHSL